MGSLVDRRFVDWLDALERRHLGELTFSELRRSLQALSSLYVDRRGRLAAGRALDGTGKRAAFALFYGPLHFLLTRHVVRSIESGSVRPPPSMIADLGCGTGAAGAAWALEIAPPPPLLGVELHPWAAKEAGWTWRALGLVGRMRRGRLQAAPWRRPRAAVLLAYSANELDEAARLAMLPELLAHRERGGRVLVIEPIARRIVPWWPDWSRAFVRCGGREDEWRVRVDLPERLRLLDRAAGLDHRELTARSLYLS